MNRALRPAKQTIWNILQECGTRPCLSQPLLSRTAYRKSLILSSTFVSKIQSPPTGRLSSARCLSSSPVISPGDIRSPLPDLDIPVISFPELIFRSCDQFKDKVAVSDYMTGRKYTFQQLKEYSIRVASALHRQGYRKGDIITTFTINLPEFTILILAAACLGVVVSPGNPAYKAGELSHMVAHNGAIAVFTIPQLLPLVQDAIEDPSLPHKVKAVYTFGHREQGAQFFHDLMEDDGKGFPENVDINPQEDVMILPYSSGTTGLPKGVMLSHYNLVANILQFRALLHLTPEDKALGVLPFFHIYGLLPLQFGTVIGGAHLTTVPRFEPEMFLQVIQDLKISMLHLVPPLVLFMAKSPLVSQFDVSSVKFIVCGAAPLGVDLTIECQDRLGISIYQDYGMTETGSFISMDSSPGYPGTTGYVVPNTRTKLVNLDTGEPVGVGEMGEYCMKGPQQMLGYYKNQQATDEMIDPDGWLHTGDLGYMREDGFVVIEDRLKELIKFKGNQVPPAELEGLLLTHPAVQDAGVIGIPSVEAGELPRAYVVLKPNMSASAQDIMDFVEERVSSSKKLRGGVEFVDEIPKTPSGKILRRILKARALQTS